MPFLVIDVRLPLIITAANPFFYILLRILHRMACQMINRFVFDKLNPFTISLSFANLMHLQFLCHLRTIHLQ